MLEPTTHPLCFQPPRPMEHSFTSRPWDALGVALYCAEREHAGKTGPVQLRHCTVGGGLVSLLVPRDMDRYALSQERKEARRRRADCLRMAAEMVGDECAPGAPTQQNLHLDPLDFGEWYSVRRGSIILDCYY